MVFHGCKVANTKLLSYIGDFVKLKLDMSRFNCIANYADSE